MKEIKRRSTENREPLSEHQKWANKPAKAGDGNLSMQSHAGPRMAISEQMRGIPAAKPQKPDLEAWREAYRIYTHYAPLLRAAAAEDGEDNDTATQLFCETLERVRAMCEPGGDAAILGQHCYDMLADVWKEARRVENR